VNDRYLKTSAIVLSSTQFGEGHKIVKLYTEMLGRIEATAFGARKTKSRFGSRLEPFTTGTFLLYRKNEQSPLSVQDVDVISQNREIRDDLDKFLFGSAIIEPVVRYVERVHCDKELFEILSSTLAILNSIPVRKCMYLLSMYDLHFISIMGYKPDWSTCVRCSKPIDSKESFSDGVSGFPLCARCRTASSISVKPGAMRFVEWALNNPLGYAEKVTMNENTLSQIRQVIEHLFLHTFRRIPESWHQIRTMLDTSQYTSGTNNRG
jgi:DNA repair protein RecO (recombination protein O)